ncbi:MAG: hypothetical protein FWF92_04360 [Oscillospiraceae bacterium]|nr:hypothetical protein [Oscillospiraceae bacterium]
MGKSEKIRRQTKMLSILLTFVLLVINIFSAGTNAQTLYEENTQRQNDGFTTFTPNDPLEDMKDIPIAQRENPDDIWELSLDPERLELDEELRRELELHEPAQDDGSTDRYTYFITFYFL